MSFLSPFTALIAAAVAIPLLVLLYVLKLRRRTLRMPTTLLWTRSYEDLEVNAPFRRLRLTALFLLQLAILVLLLVAFAEPATDDEGGASPTYVLLMDVSASMAARTPDVPEATSRFERAKIAALEIVRQRTTGGRRDAGLIVSVGRRPRLLTDFEPRFDRLRVALDALEITDEEADLEAALQLVASLAPAVESSESAMPPDVYLVSDGGVLPPTSGGGYPLPGGTFEVVPLPADVVDPAAPAPATDALENLGITTLSARRDADDPTRVRVFVRLVNAGPAPVTTTLALDVEGRDSELATVTVPAPEPEPAAAPGETTHTFVVTIPEAALIRARQTRVDALPADDVAAAVLPAPRRLRVVLVRGDAGADPFLQELLGEAELESLDVLTAREFAGLDAATIDNGDRYDLAIFDRASPERLPGIPSLTIGGVPPALEVREPADAGGARVMSWSRQHPLMRHVSLDELVYAGFGGFVVPSSATVLASGPAGPIMLELQSRSARHVVVGFALDRSTWTRQLSFAVFMQNVLDVVGGRQGGSASRVSRPGEPVTVRVGATTTSVRVTGPDDFESTIEPSADRTVGLPAFRRVGLYRVEGAVPPDDRIAVSLLSDVETDLRPRTELEVLAEIRRTARTGPPPRRVIWPWFVGAAFVLLVLEWLLYCFRMRV